jgi:hypothetical protein
MGSHPVKRTADTRRPTVEHMDIDHGRFDLAMSQQLLDGSNACLCVARRQVRTAFE